MRELIDVNFVDKTNYASQASGDIGGILLTHFWGPAERLNTLTFAEFLSLYPVSTLRLTDSWINAFRAFQSGLSTIEIKRVLSTTEQYTHFPLTGVTPAKGKAEKLDVLIKPSLALRYAGFPQPLVDGKVLVVSVVDISDEDGYTEIPEVKPLRVSVYLLTSEEAEDVTTNTDLVAYTPVEVFEGVSEIGYQLDGVNAFVGSKIQAKSQYLQFVNNTQEPINLTNDFVIKIDFDGSGADEITYKTSDDLAEGYAATFSDIEISSATILIDPGTTAGASAKSFLKAASVGARSDLVAVVGYPTGATDFNKDAILTYKQGLSAEQFGAFYAARELVTVKGVNYLSNGAGTIAGRIAAVAASASVNQLPSAKTWGFFGGVISESFPFKDVLALHEKGVNSVYASVDGARIFGLRSLHARASSYYAKFNVSRVSARILRYGFSVALNAIHTGNTGALKMSVQSLLEADLTRLIASGDIRSQSSVLCADSNNQDIDTNGGEILIIDYEIYFVKLVERVRFTITATDNSVSVSQS